MDVTTRAIVPARLRTTLRFFAATIAAVCGMIVAAGPRGGSAGAPAAARPAPPALAWPLAVPGTLLSAFGEYRYDHLHAGIDISTAGATGHRVLAADSGVVYRLKVEWRGYGRALYLRHAGGRVSVYGHLERFEDAVLGLERLVARRQREGGTRYPGDLYLDPPLRVKRGQVIAYSGESGVGLPHLHFEVREGEERPVDPFIAGLRAPRDDRPPVLDELIVTAADAASFVDGTLRERVYRLVRRGGIHETATPVRVRGAFLVAVAAHDPAGAEGRAGIRAVRLRVDGRTVYDLTWDRFSFDQYPQAGLIYDHRFSRLGPARYVYRLLRLPGNQLATGDLETPAGPESVPGALALPSGAHRLEIRVEDAARNVGRASICLQVAPSVDPVRLLAAQADGDHPVVRFALDAEGGAPPGTGRPPAPGCPAPAPAVEAELWPVGGTRFSTMRCRTDEGVCVAEGASIPEGGVIRLREVRGGVPGPWTLAAVGRSLPEMVRAGEVQITAWPSFMDLIVPLSAPGVPPLSIAAWPAGGAVVPLEYRDAMGAGAGLSWVRAAAIGPLALRARDGGDPVLLPDARFVEPRSGIAYRGPGFSVDLPQGSRFYPGPLVVRTERIAGPPGLPALSEAVELLPYGESLDARATLAFDLQTSTLETDPLGIYRWDPDRGRWSYEGGEVAGTGSQRALVLRFRRYGRFALLQDASPPRLLDVSPASGGRVSARAPRFTARVEDEGEGLGADGVRFVLDGAPLESEFDPDRGRAAVLEPPRLSPGRHRLSVTAYDQAGNASETKEIVFEAR